MQKLDGTGREGTEGMLFLNGFIFLIAMCVPRERIWGQA